MDVRYHAYYECSCGKKDDTINTEKGKERECPVCGKMNKPQQEVSWIWSHFD